MLRIARKAKPGLRSMMTTSRMCLFVDTHIFKGSKFDHMGQFKHKHVYINL